MAPKRPAAAAASGSASEASDGEADAVHHQPSSRSPSKTPPPNPNPKSAAAGLDGYEIGGGATANVYDDAESGQDERPRKNRGWRLYLPRIPPPMDPAALGRFDKLQSSFKLTVQCLLTVCSREGLSQLKSHMSWVVNEAFSSFTDAEKERLHRMLTLDDFNDFCQQTQVAAALEKIDDFVELQNLDALSSEGTSVEEIEEKVSRAKKDEIEHLTGLLKKVEESNNAMKARIELLKKGEEDSTAARDVLNKVTQWNCALNNR